MSWICEVCGYENIFDDDNQPTQCQCCFSEAKPEQIAKAKRELEAFHKERIKQEKLEALHRKIVQKQRQIEKAITSIINTIKIATVGCIAAIVICIGLLIISVVQGDISIRNIPSNATSILDTQKISDPLLSIATDSRDRLTSYFDSLAEKEMNTHNNQALNFSNNILLIQKEIVQNLSTTDTNRLMLVDNISLTRNNFFKFAPSFTSNIQNGFKNSTVNIPKCWDNAVHNITQLVDKISDKLGRDK